MLRNISSLNSTQVDSPLRRASHLGSKQKSRKIMDAPVLSLTSLIDAFSIIVIYLLVGTTMSQVEVPVSPTLKLPEAVRGEILSEEIPIVRVENGKYFIENNYVPENQLGRKLFELKEKFSLKKAPSTAGVDNGDGSQKRLEQILVQADQQSEFKLINPLILASSEAGIKRIKFAVVPQQ